MSKVPPAYRFWTRTRVANRLDAPVVRRVLDLIGDPGLSRLGPRQRLMLLARASGATDAALARMRRCTPGTARIFLRRALEEATGVAELRAHAEELKEASNQRRRARPNPRRRLRAYMRMRVGRGKRLHWVELDIVREKSPVAMRALKPVQYLLREHVSRPGFELSTAKAAGCASVQKTDDSSGPLREAMHDLLMTHLKTRGGIIEIDWPTVPLQVAPPCSVRKPSRWWREPVSYIDLAISRQHGAK